MPVGAREKARRSGRAPGAPKPKVEPRKTPFTKRPGVRRTAIVVVALLVLLGALKLWGNLSRASDLRAYVKALTRAEEPFITFNVAGAPENLVESHRRFGQGGLSAGQVRASADRWEKSFAAARDAVRALKPPSRLRAANEMVASGIDGYVGIARMYTVAAAQHELVAKAKGATARKAQDGQFQLLMQHIEEARTRAQALYDAGIKEIQDLKRSWGVSGADPRTPDPGGGASVGGPTGIPPGFGG